MSSVERSFRAIDSNVKFLVSVASASNVGFTIADLKSARDAAVDAGTISDLGSVINVIDGPASDFITACSPTADVGSAGLQYRDLGKTLYIQENAKNYAIYKLVALISGSASEGVPAGQTADPQTSFPIYLPVWTASGSGIANLARTGY